jgi:pimeloyl-ACP methyl ester carboxylesterase
VPTFLHDGVTFNYADAGRGLPFFFLHGLGNDISQPMSLLPEHQGIRLLSFDFRSHGASFPEPGPSTLNIATFADDVAAFQRHLGIETVVLGGTSLGAAVALNFAVRNPCNVLGLVLSRPAWLNVPNPANLQILSVVASHIRNYGARKGAEIFAGTTDFKRLQQTSKAAAFSVRRLFDDPLATERVRRFELIPRSTPFETFNELSQLSAATLVIGNDRDPIHPLQTSTVLAEWIPQSRLRIVTSQAVGAEAHRTEVRREILEFLGSLSL